MKNIQLSPLSLVAGSVATVKINSCMRLPMRYLTSIALVIPALAGPGFAQTQVLIIESQSQQSSHDMDFEWANVASSAGYAVLTGTQGDLASSAFHGTTDVLVVSSGVIALPAPAATSIADFLAQGGRVYLQGEYMADFSTNQLFASLVNANGGTFAWTVALPGNLDPVTVSAPLDGPLPVAPLDYYWHGVTGTGTGISVAMQDVMGRSVGWTFEYPGGGRLVHSTDQDWVRSASSEDMALMENILTWLSSGVSCGPLCNIGTNYCTSTPNSTGLPALISATGSASVAANDLILRAQPVPAQQNGVFFYGLVQVQVPFGNGFLCIGAGGTGIARLTIENSGPAGVLEHELDNTMPTTAATQITAGSTWFFQAWFRDPAAGGALFDLSDGLSVVFGP